MKLNKHTAEVNGIRYESWRWNNSNYNDPANGQTVIVMRVTPPDGRVWWEATVNTDCMIDTASLKVKFGVDEDGMTEVDYVRLKNMLDSVERVTMEIRKGDKVKP